MCEHRQDAANGVFPHRLFVLHLPVEWSELGNAGPLAHPELDPPVADQIEAGHLFCDACGVVGRQLNNAVAEPDISCPLARRSKKHLRLWRVGVFFEKMVLDVPGVVVTEAVGQLDLRQGVLVELPFIVRPPGTRQLQLVEDAELHPFLRNDYRQAHASIPGSSSIPYLHSSDSPSKSRNSRSKAG
jgi:hypothetical protein